jgi:hypothetical protein
MPVDVNILADTLPSFRKALVGSLPPDESRRCDCLRCGYNWSPKRYEDRADDSYAPRKCPNCGSTGWYSERVEPPPTFNCLRCTYQWQAKSREHQADGSYRPAFCPGCKSTRWDESPDEKVEPTEEVEPPPPAARERPLMISAREDSTSASTRTLCSLGLLHQGTPRPKRN